jgi:2-keto-4-pentenoate hydratase
MQLSEPFRAPLFQDTIIAEPRTAVDLARTNLTLLEAEFGLVLSKSLPPRSTPYTAADVMDAVSVVIPSIEVCASRLSGAAFQESTPFHRLADGGGNDSCRIGEAFDAGGIDGTMSRLDTVQVRFLVNGEAPGGVAASNGSGADVLGHPARALAWLANSLIEGQTSTGASKYGGESVIGLQAGDFVMSGAAAVLPATSLQPGDTVVAEFEGMGSVELVITKGETSASGDESETAGAARMSNEAWRELCAQARAPGDDGKPAMDLPMIYPWSPAREAAVREVLGSATGRAKV